MPLNRLPPLLPLRALAVVLAAASVRADPVDDLKEAMTHVNRLELDKAEAALDRVIEAKPDFGLAYLARARLRARHDDPKGAAEDAIRACELGAGDWPWAVTVARNAEDYALAAKAAEGAYANGGDAKNLALAADSFEAAGAFEEAIRMYARLAEVETDNNVKLEARMNLGKLRSLNGDHEAGLAELDAVLADAPRAVRAFQIRGRIRLRKGDVKMALADYVRAQQLTPSDASVYLVLGLAYFDIGDYQSATATLERAVGFHNAHKYAQLYLFLARCRTGVPANRLRAKRELMGYLEGRASQDDWFSMLGGYMIGTLPEKDLLEAARKGSRDLQREQLCEAWGYIGQMAMIAGDAEKAVKCFQECVATKVGDFMEYGSADMELRRLGKR